jgi:iron complex outermembrane receptor protein
MKRFSPKLLCLLVAPASLGSVAQESGHNHKDEKHIERIIVESTQLGRSALELAVPASVLTGEALNNNQGTTLGETLKNVPGVHDSYYGPVAGSPVIRGLDGPRVKVVQNGLDTSDVSRVGPDHPVSTESSTAEQIEVLRGPATLLYGSGAIGGVVNVIDNRLPSEIPSDTAGEIGLLYNDVSEETHLHLNADGGSGKFAWHVDAFDRQTEDYSLPDGTINDEGEEIDTLDNSSIDAQGFTLGAGWIADDVSFALSYGRLENDYGIPGHSHHHHEDEHDEEHEEGEEHGEDHDDEHAEEEEVFGSIEQDRWQAKLDWDLNNTWLQKLHWHNAYTDFTQAEIEGGQTGTTFENDTFESRLWADLKSIADWQGIIGLHYTDTDYVADGEEAFSPPTQSDMLALFVLGEKQTGNWIWQLGGRLEDVTLSPDNAFFEHEEEHDEEEHEEGEEHEEHEEIFFNDPSYTAFSLSAGGVYKLDNQRSVAFNLSRASRAPSSAEAFSNGLHIATNTFEIGAGFALKAEGDGYEVVQADGEVEKETSTNLDISYRYQSDDYAIVLGAYYNLVDNYLYQQDTGLTTEQLHGHEHDHEDEHADEHEGEHEEEHGHEEESVPILLFQQQDVTLYGFELEIDAHLNDQWRIDLWADYTKAELDQAVGGSKNLPRIPPMRIGTNLHWEQDQWHAELGAVYYAKQDEVAALETETDSYTLFSAQLNYYLTWQNTDISLFLKGKNLTDEEARVHNSFLKDQAPLPGREISLGFRVNF